MKQTKPNEYTKLIYCRDSEHWSSLRRSKSLKIIDCGTNPYATSY